MVLHACSGDETKNTEADNLNREARYYLTENTIIERSTAGYYAYQATAKRDQLNEFLNRSGNQSSNTKAIADLRLTRDQLIGKITEIGDQSFQTKYRPDLPTIGTAELFANKGTLQKDNDIWAHGLRQHLRQNEQPSASTATIYSGLWDHIGPCTDLRNLLQSEFVNDDIQAKFQADFEKEIRTKVPDHQVVLVFDLALGEYNTANQTFPVERVLLGDEHPSFVRIYKGWSFEGDDIALHNKQKRECTNISAHSSKAHLNVPKELKIDWTVKLPDALAALKSPVLISASLAEKEFAKIDPARRSVYAFAYFDQVQWSSKGNLQSGKTHILGQSRLKHIEYYFYDLRDAHRNALYFDVKERRKRPLGGSIMPETLFEGRPISKPFSTKGF